MTTAMAKQMKVLWAKGVLVSSVLVQEFVAKGLPSVKKQRKNVKLLEHKQRYAMALTITAMA